MKLNEIDFNHIKFDGQTFNEIFKKVLRTTNPELIKQGLQLLETESRYQVLLVENKTLSPVLIPHEHLTDHFFVGINVDLNYESSGILYAGNSSQVNWSALSFRYLLVYKQVKDLINDHRKLWKTNGLITFLVRPGDFYPESEARLCDIKKEIFQTHNSIELLKANANLDNGQIRELEDHLRKLRWQYDQSMLSKMVKGETDSEVSGWWHNRY